MNAGEPEPACCHDALTAPSENTVLLGKWAGESKKTDVWWNLIKKKNAGNLQK